MTDNSAETKMPITSHLEELRKRLVRSLVAIGIGMGICYNFKEQLFNILTYPLSEALPKNSYMIYTSLPEAFFNYLKISFFAGLMLVSPYVLYQIWKFVSPGLYQSEKKYVLPFVIVATLLFAGGVSFCYFLVLPPAFKFFTDFSTDFLKPMLSLREYLSLALKLLLVFGIMFEIPVFLFFLAKLGVITPAFLAKQRKYAILIIFIAAAVLTPTPDAFTQILMAIPMIVLYEVSIIVIRVGIRKPKAQASSPVDDAGADQE
ncbi:MAG: twin-arginine translocase subunit TatC [Syntrophaceae bacterium]